MCSVKQEDNLLLQPALCDNTKNPQINVCFLYFIAKKKDVNMVVVILFFFFDL